MNETGPDYGLTQSSDSLQGPPIYKSQSRDKTTMKQHRHSNTLSDSNSVKKPDVAHSHPKAVTIPRQSCDFAEFLGIYFGDGSARENPPVLAISLSLSEEKEYALFVSGLIKRLFNISAGLAENRKVDNLQVRIYRVSLVRFFHKNIRKESGFPYWVKRKLTYLMAFLRGIIDTEGSVYRVEREKKRIRIEIKMYNKKLLQDLFEALKLLGFRPRIYVRRNRVTIARQDDVDRYFNKVCSHNPKHVKRYLCLREDHSLNAPVV